MLLGRWKECSSLLQEGGRDQQNQRETERYILPPALFTGYPGRKKQKKPQFHTDTEKRGKGLWASHPFIQIVPREGRRGGASNHPGIDKM